MIMAQDLDRRRRLERAHGASVVLSTARSIFQSDCEENRTVQTYSIASLGDCSILADMSDISLHS